MKGIYYRRELNSPHKKEMKLEKINYSKFPCGEINIKFPDIVQKEINFVVFLFSSDDIMALFLIVDAVRRKHKFVSEIEIAYLPYGRQDKIFNDGEPLSLRVFYILLNTLECHIKIISPHSNLYLDKLNNYSIEYVIPRNILSEYNGIIIPDLGASSMFKMTDLTNKEVVQIIKNRNLTTGKIKNIKAIGWFKNSSHAIIVDDICDGGATFIKIAKLFPDMKIDLFVTHGIFSKGLDVLKPHLNHIYCYYTRLEKNEIDKEFLTIKGDYQ